MTRFQDKMYQMETIKEMNLKMESLKEHSLFNGASATFGVVAIVTRDLGVLQIRRFIGLVPNEGFDIDFLYTLFLSTAVVKLEEACESAGSTIFYISRQTFEKMDVIIPPLKEQVKTRIIFKSLDNLITLHQRELETYQNLKKTMLEKMFV